VKRSAIVAAAALLVCLAWWMLARVGCAPGKAASRTGVADGRSAAERTIARGADAIEADWLALLDGLGDGVPSDSQALRARLLAMRGRWLRNEPVLVAETIGALLRSGHDRRTGLRFEVGPGGFLAAWPSLRVFLIDVLAGADPEKAAALGREILATTANGDEYAAALRLIVREGKGKAPDAELLACLGAMLARDGWRDSRGVAEAFDLARVIGNAAAARMLVDQAGNPALRNMALHEFGAAHPAALLEAIGDNRTGLDAGTHAGLLARADPSDPAQAAAVDAFLRDPRTRPGDASAFLERFPLRSATTGYRLFGNPPPAFTREGVRRGDEAALRLAEAWAADPSLRDHHQDIEALRRRLGEWLEEP
jgi:hypothetical protein